MNDSLAAISVGGSHIRLGVHDGSGWKARWLVKTVLHRTSDEYRILFSSLFRESSLPPPGRIMTVSAVPGLTSVVSSAMRTLGGVEPVVVTVRMRSNLNMAPRTAEDPGADLFANAVAAYHRYRTSCVVVNFCTELSFTAVDSEGNLRGFSIAPGVQTSLDSLVSSAARLQYVDLEDPGPAIGTDTARAIRSGIVYGYAGLVDGIVSRMKAELPDPVYCLATGDFSGLVVPFCSEIDHVDPHLTLEGLLILARLNP